MNSKLLTYGAVAFAGFALYYITRTPGTTLATQAGQQQRDAMLTKFHDLLTQQSAIFSGSVGGVPWSWTPDPYSAGTFHS
jgi:hypothetical protein